MDLLVRSLKAAALAAVAFTLVAAGQLLIELRRTAATARVVFAELPVRLERQVETQGREARAAALRAVEAAAGQLTGQVAGLRADVRALGGEVVRTADGRLASLEYELAAQLALARAGFDENFDRANRDLARIGDLAASARRTTDAVAEASELILDPTFPDSLQNRTIGLMQATERAARTFAAEAPATAQAIRESSQNIARVTDRLAKPAPWWSRALTATVAALTGYRLLHRF